MDDPASCSAQRAGASARLAIGPSGVSFTDEHGVSHDIISTTVEKSDLLRGLVLSSGESAEAYIPVSIEALVLWTNHVRQPWVGAELDSQPSPPGQKRSHRNRCSASNTSGHFATATGHERPCPGASVVDAGAQQPAHVQAKHIKRLCLLISAADVLVDEETKAQAAAETSALLRAACTSAATAAVSNASTVVHTLPDHLLTAILQDVPLSHCLRHLPTTFHATALRAHCPSIDTHHSLPLPCLPPSLLPAAMHASATFSGLEALCLTSHTLPPDSPSHLTRLSSLSALTSLTLQEAALKLPHARALASALPAMPRLRTLDLSRNCITADVMHALAPGLRQCAALRGLDLMHAMHSCEDRGSSAAPPSPYPVLAAALQADNPLTTISISTYELSQQPHAAAPADMHALLQSLACISTLSHLHLDFQNDPHPTQPSPWPQPLASMSQLGSLHLVALPSTRSTHSTRPARKRAPQAAASGSGSALGEALSQLVGLTALDLDLTHRNISSPATAALVATVSSLTRLQSLQLCLFFPYVSGGDIVAPACTALADALSTLSALTALRLRSAHRGRAHTAAFGGERSSPDCPLVARIASAVLRAAPALRELHVPVTTAASDHEELLAVLGKAAARLQQLSVELYVWLATVMAEPEDENTDELPIVIHCAVHQYTQLLPYAEKIDVFYYDRSMPEEVMRPLAAAGAQLSRLQALTLTARPVRNDGPVRDFIESVAHHCTALRALDVDLAVWPTLASDPDYGYLKLQRFFGNLGSLTRLTRLCWAVGDVCTSTLPEPRLVPAAAALTQLRVFHVRPYVGEQFGKYVALFESLAVRTALIVIQGRAHSESLEDLLPRMPHLRAVTLRGAQRGCQQRLRAAVAALPECHLI